MVYGIDAVWHGLTIRIKLAGIEIVIVLDWREVGRVKRGSCVCHMLRCWIARGRVGKITKLGFRVRTL